MLAGGVCLVQPTLLPEASRVDIYEYSLALARLGVDTHVIVSRDLTGGTHGRPHVHALGFPPVNTPASWWRFARGALATLRRLGSDSDVRIAHLFNPSPATYLLGWMLRREKNRPAIVYDLRTGGLGHRPDALLTNAMARTAPLFADAMVALSAALGAKLLGEGRFHEVPLGVNPERFRRAAASATGRQEFVFVYAGTLGRRRALRNMLAAFADVVREHPHARLVIAGDGDDRRRLEAFVAARNMGHAVRFLGKRPFSEMPGLLGAADCGLAYVPEDPWFQPQPQLKTLEYFAMGLPVVAVGTAGNRQYWEGLPPELLTGANPESFAAGMRFVLAQRGELMPARFRRVAEAFSWERITRERLLPLYETLLARRACRA